MYGIVAVAEGATPIGGGAVAKSNKEVGRGYVLLGGIGKFAAKRLPPERVKIPGRLF
jgi:hypothetical protein